MSVSASFKTVSSASASERDGRTRHLHFPDIQADDDDFRMFDNLGVFRFHTLLPSYRNWESSRRRRHQERYLATALRIVFSLQLTHRDFTNVPFVDGILFVHQQLAKVRILQNGHMQTEDAARGCAVQFVQEKEEMKEKCGAVFFQEVVLPFLYYRNAWVLSGRSADNEFVFVIKVSDDDGKDGSKTGNEEAGLFVACWSTEQLRRENDKHVAESDALRGLRGRISLVQTGPDNDPVRTLNVCSNALCQQRASVTSSSDTDSSVSIQKSTVEVKARAPTAVSGAGDGESDPGENAVCFKKCGLCKLARYCSRSCQVQDWKNGHKEECFGKQAAPLTPSTLAVSAPVAVGLGKKHADSDDKSPSTVLSVLVPDSVPLAVDGTSAARKKKKKKKNKKKKKVAKSATSDDVSSDATTLD